MKPLLPLLFLALGLPLSAADQPAEKPRPQIALLDVVSSSYDLGKSRILTDMIQSELFKTHLFRIMERGVVQKALDEKKLASGYLDASLLNLGKNLGVEKVFVCTIEKFGDTIALNVRIVDVNTSLVDYTENVLIKNENQLFDALKEMVVKIELYYTAGQKNKDNLSAEARAYLLQVNWEFLGAKVDDLTYLLERRQDPDEYLSLRQYDISFTPAQYVKTKKSGMDLGVVKTFLQNGIPYPVTERALTLGVTKLDKYKEVFQFDGYSFEDYLEAYEKGITTLEGYRDYKQGFRREFLVLGAGGVADTFPIANAVFKYPVGQLGWEHFWTRYQRDWFKTSSDLGIYLLQGWAPIPYAEFNAYFGAAPFYGKVSLGGIAEILLGGHFGLTAKIGFEVLERYEVDLFMVPVGTEPNVSYVDFKTRQGDPGYQSLKFPYYGAVFKYKY